MSVLRFLVPALAAFTIGCFGPYERGPRYVDVSERDSIDPSGKFSGFHLHGIPHGWYYLAETRSSPGDRACVAAPMYDAIFWMSARPLYDDPTEGVQTIQRLRGDAPSEGQWLGRVEVSPDLASVTYLVDREMNGEYAEFQRTAIRRVTNKRGETATMSIHGRWPRQYDWAVSPIFDQIVLAATYE